MTGASPHLGRETAAGALWVSGAGFVTQALTLVSGVLVARHLPVEDYGTAAMAMVVVSLGTVFLSFGLAPAIISGRLSDPSAIRSSHGFLVLVGLALTGLVVAGSAPAARFFDNEAVSGLLAVASLILLLGSWEVVPLAVIQANRRFDRLAFVNVASQTVQSLSAIAMAVLGADVWALVLPWLIGGGLRAAAATALAPGFLRPRLVFSEVRPHLRELLHVSATSLADYLFFNADKVILGRLHGELPLGRYNFANSLVARSLFAFSRALGAPLLASLGALRDDLERFDRATVRAGLAVARLTFPICVGGALLAPELVHALVGSRWDVAVDLVRIFFVLGALQSVGQLSGPVWLAMGKFRLAFLWSLATNTALVGVFLAGAIAGSSEGVALAFAAYSWFLAGPACVWVTRRVCGVPLRGLGMGLLRVARDVLGMAIVLLLAGLAGSSLGLPAWALLALEVPLGAVTYGLLFRLNSAGELSSLLATLPAPARRLGYSLFRLSPAV